MLLKLDMLMDCLQQSDRELTSVPLTKTKGRSSGVIELWTVSDRCCPLRRAADQGQRAVLVVAACCIIVREHFVAVTGYAHAKLAPEESNPLARSGMGVSNV